MRDRLLPMKTLSAKQEQFAFNIALGKPVTEAATLARYANPLSNAYRLMDINGMKVLLMKLEFMKAIVRGESVQAEG